MYRAIWWKNKPVIYSKSEVYQAFSDLLQYYQKAPENINTAATKQALIYILEVKQNDKYNIQRS